MGSHITKQNLMFRYRSNLQIVLKIIIGLSNSENYAITIAKNNNICACNDSGMGLYVSVWLHVLLYVLF